MTKHFLVCSKCPADIKKYFMSESKVDDCEGSTCQHCRSRSPVPSVPSSSSSQSVVQSAASGDRLTSLPNVSKKPPGITTFGAKMTSEDQAFARAMYASRASVPITENTYQHEAFKLLRPSYHLPSRYSLSRPLLESECEHVMQSVQEEINKVLCLTLLTDGGLMEEEKE